MEFTALTEAKGKLNAARKSLSDVFAEAGKDLNMSQIKSLSGDNADKLSTTLTLSRVSPRSVPVTVTCTKRRLGTVVPSARLSVTCSRSRPPGRASGAVCARDRFRNLTLTSRP